MIILSAVTSDGDSAVFIAAVFPVIFVCSVNLNLYPHGQTEK